MDVGIGLPNSVAGANGDELLEFARRADAAGFSTLGTIDRIVYDNHEPLTTLAGAAAITERIQLMTTILLGPLRTNAAILAKQAATIHSLSGGRFRLGVAIGAREDDYEISGVPMTERGERLDNALDLTQRIWRGEEFGVAGAIGPDVRANPPEVIIGGSAAASFNRAARYGAGWMLGGGSPDQFAQARESVLSAWKEAGRDDEPKLMTLGYYALGPNAEEAAREDLLHYYAWLGDEVAGMIAGSAATDADTIKQYAKAYADAGCDELVLFATSSDPDQVDLLADAVL